MPEKKQSIFRNSIFAAFLMIVMIAFAVFIGNYRSLHKLQSELEAAFSNGVDGNGYSIQRDLDEIYEQSYNIVAIARKYYSEDSPFITAVMEARTELASAVSVGEKYSAATALIERSTALYLELKDNAEVKSTHVKLAAQYYTEIGSRRDTIQNDGYNLLAEEFNKTLDSFPVSLVYRLVGVSRAELFR